MTGISTTDTTVALAKIVFVKPLIAPSILAADFAHLADEISAVMDGGADVIHFDVMDNHYVPNLTVGPTVLASLRKHFPELPVDVHLMVEPVDSLIDEFLDLKASYISIHPEAAKHPHASLNRIRSGGCKAGVVLNPGTPINDIEYLLDVVDLVLVMSVNPGFGGQKFIESSLVKIDQIKQLIRSRGLQPRLEVDGGITVENIGLASRAGADMFVAGSAIFGSASYSDTISLMRQQLQ